MKNGTKSAIHAFPSSVRLKHNIPNPRIHMTKGTKRKGTTEDRQQHQNMESMEVGRPRKRSKVSKQCEWEELWKQAVPIGTEWAQLDLLSEYKWDFSNVGDAFEEGGVLHGKRVYVFSLTEPQFLEFGGKLKVTCVPVVVAVVSPFPPSDKIGITSVQRGEEIVDMKQMKMDWVPYIPLEKRGCSVERLKPQIFVLSCSQRRAGLKQLELDRVMKFQYCLPYFYHPFKEDETEQSTEVKIIYPIEPNPVELSFDWKMDELEEITNELIETEELSKDHKDAFKEFVKEKVLEGKKANREAKQKRKNAQESMSQDKKDAFENIIKFYKFYPVPTPFTPNPDKQASVINRYYGKAHYVI